MDINEALKSLDPKDDGVWTSNGLPRMDVMIAATGNEELKRKDVTNADPHFSRETVGAPVPANLAEAPIETGPVTNVVLGANETPSKMSDDGNVTVEPAPSSIAIPIDTIEKGTKLEQARDLLALQMYAANREATAARKHADDLANQVNAKNRELDSLMKEDPNWQMKGIQTYIKQQNINRHNAKAGLTRFIEATGIHPKDVARAVDPRSKLDQSLNGRRSPRPPMRPSTR